mmetsp:Transcript_2568/g.7818  ORF Transcript_2568/g.7818 Transcript_2568/m.7818 type:complete len:289 (+) Transcript_2568:499-1365(+)
MCILSSLSSVRALLANVPRLPGDGAGQTVLRASHVDVHLDPVQAAGEAVQRGPGLNLEGFHRPGLLLVKVEVDDVAHLLPVPVHVPVVPVEGNVAVKQGPHPRHGAQVVRPAEKPRQLGLVLLVVLRVVQRLPPLHHLPRPLVHTVVEENNVLHILLVHAVGLALAVQGVEEHLRRGISPRGLRAALGDRARFSVHRKRFQLPHRRLLVCLQRHVVLRVEGARPAAPPEVPDRAEVRLLPLLRFGLLLLALCVYPLVIHVVDGRRSLRARRRRRRRRRRAKINWARLV